MWALVLIATVWTGLAVWAAVEIVADCRQQGAPVDWLALGIVAVLSPYYFGKSLFERDAR